ncbi:restriction endonuclease subunit S [Vogesella sp. EB]|uniref:restriction endonuclease subunit S n=1 Tax=Vogesella sp. EB TaxID=1526735 RepID=UPI0009E51137|nr:restriction endonuclease subunit S [Vogesella sp. EB]
MSAYYNLLDICRPKQWPTISGSEMSGNGYPVYGANGIIGKHDEFTHEKPTIMITCRGATCGNLNISEGRCYINGNAMALDELDEEKIHLPFLYYFLQKRGFEDVISGSAQPQITRQGLTNITVPKVPLEEQKRIAAILDKADSLRRKRAQATALADNFLRATFLEMFGDPVTNPKGWEVCSVGDVTTCIVPGRDKPKSFTGMTPWVTTKDLIHLGLTANSIDRLGLDDDEISGVKAKTVPSGAVLMTCVGDLGVLSISDSDMVINQQLHAFLCSQDVINSFLMYALSFQKPYMQSMASSTTLPYMNKTICNGIPVFKPPLPLQKRFNDFFLKIQSLKKSLSVATESGTVLISSCSEKYMNI